MWPIKRSLFLSLYQWDECIFCPCNCVARKQRRRASGGEEGGRKFILHLDFVAVVSAWRWNVASLTFQVIGVHSFNLCCDILFLLSKQPVQTGRCVCVREREGQKVSCLLHMFHWQNNFLSLSLVPASITHSVDKGKCMSICVLTAALSSTQSKLQSLLIRELKYTEQEERREEREREAVVWKWVKECENRPCPMKQSSRRDCTRLDSLDQLYERFVWPEGASPLLFSLLSDACPFLWKKVKRTKHLESDEEKVFESHRKKQYIILICLFCVWCVFAISCDCWMRNSPVKEREKRADGREKWRK